MIYYSTKEGYGILFSLKGSVFPRAVRLALPAMLLSIFMKILMVQYADDYAFLENSAAFSGFAFIVSFILVFRTSQAYNRFWEGATAIHKMSAKWLEASSMLVVFSATCRKDNGERDDKVEEQVLHFQHVLIRLVSLLHCIALHRMADKNTSAADEFELVGVEDLDVHRLSILRGCEEKVTVCMQWIQKHVCDFFLEVQPGVIPPPVLSRVFQELSLGMCQYYETLKISDTPFPFPYAQMISLLLFLYSVFTPLVICSWVGHWALAGLFSFIAVFGFNSINLIACELEQPFGDDVNDLPMFELQQVVNRHLLNLLHPNATFPPRLRPQFAEALLEGSPKTEASTLGAMTEHIAKGDPTKADPNARDAHKVPKADPAMPTSTSDGHGGSSASTSLKPHLHASGREESHATMKARNKESSDLPQNVPTELTQQAPIGFGVTTPCTDESSARLRPAHAPEPLMADPIRSPTSSPAMNGNSSALMHWSPSQWPLKPPRPPIPPDDPGGFCWPPEGLSRI